MQQQLTLASQRKPMGWANLCDSKFMQFSGEAGERKGTACN